MKKVSIIIALFIVIVSCKGNETKVSNDTKSKTEKQDPKLKRYEIKSGIVHYKSTVSGKVMGSVISGSGTEDIFFKDWGALELVETKATQTTNTNIFGQKKSETTNTHTIAKLDNGESYHVDFNKKQIFLRRDMGMDMTKTFQPNADAGKVGKSMLESMGGKKVGNEKFLGYDCEVWDVMGAKQWMYKGVVLKLEMTVMGIKTIKEATSAKFDINVPDTKFQLPNFPIIKEEGFLNNDEMDDEMKEMDANMDKLAKMSYQDWKKEALSHDEDGELKNMSEEELRQTYDMMQKMIKMRKGK